MIQGLRLKLSSSCPSAGEAEDLRHASYCVVSFFPGARNWGVLFQRFKVKPWMFNLKTKEIYGETLLSSESVNSAFSSISKSVKHGFCCLLHFHYTRSWQAVSTFEPGTLFCKRISFLLLLDLLWIILAGFVKNLS